MSTLETEVWLPSCSLHLQNCPSQAVCVAGQSFQADQVVCFLPAGLSDSWFFTPPWSLRIGTSAWLPSFTQEMNMPYGDDEILPWMLASRQLPLELPFSQLQLKKCWSYCSSENTQVFKLRSGSWVRMTTAEPGELCASCVPRAIHLLLDLGSNQTFLQPLIKSSRSSVLAPESESAC